MSSALSIAIAVLVLILIAVGFCMLNDRFMDAVFRWRNPPEKLAAEKRAYEERLLHPDWEFYERHLQRPAPAGLRSLYSDHGFLLSDDHEYDDYHSMRFCALDEQGRDECFSWLRIDVVPIANSNDDMIYLRPGAAEPDAVFITYHDGGDTEPLAPDFQTFYERLLHANRNG
jgi:hypothetical protein